MSSAESSTGQANTPASGGIPKPLTRRPAERAAVTPSQKASVPTPSGATTPMPVTTTRGSPAAIGELLQRRPLEALQRRAVEPVPVELPVAARGLGVEVVAERGKGQPQGAGGALATLL